MSKTMPKLRFRLRTMMMMVVVVALGLASAATMVRRSRQFEQMAIEHAKAAQSGADPTWGYNRFGREPGDRSYGMAAHHWAVYTRHEDLAAKYHRASAHPWWPVADDPPEPQTR